MNISKELITKLSDELINQEVKRVIDLKRAEVQKAVKLEVNKVISKNSIQAAIKKEVSEKTSNFNKELVSSMKSYFGDLDFEEIISEYIFETKDGRDSVDKMVRGMLRKIVM